MNTFRLRARCPLTPIAAVLGTAVLVTACGGGSSDADIDAPVVPANVDVKTSVIDGPIGNALVCLDKNDNGACDADEPTARSAADGSATLAVAPGDVGKYPLLAVVGTDAVDAAYGAVTQRFTLRTPADRAAAITPLTTLVAAQMALAPGQSSADAEKTLQDAANLSVSLFGDFSKDTDSSRAQAARLVTLIKQSVGATLKDAVGTADSKGVAMTQNDIDRVIERRLVDALASVVGALDASLTPAQLTAAASAIATSEVALSAATLKVLVANAKSPDVTAAPATPAAGASMEWLSYTDSNNWFFRVYTSSAAQNTPDANGRLHYLDTRKRATSGAVQAWGDAAYTRTDVYFTGTAWFVCPAGFENQSTPRDSAGRSESLYCDAYRSNSVRAVRDVAGLKMADIAAEIRAYPLASTSGEFANWGPAPASFGSAVFPAESKLYYQTTTQLKNPDAYNPLASGIVRLYTAAISGGDKAACDNVTAANSESFRHDSANLEEIVASQKGAACVFGASSSTGPRNDWGSQATLQIGSIAGPASTNPYYQSTRSLRVAFGTGSAVNYYVCALRASDGSSRNCDVAGTGTYSIETVGDARVMRFSNLPASAAALGYNRTFVERGGKVYFGYRDKLRVNNSIRPNLPATDAMLGAIGLAR